MTIRGGKRLTKSIWIFFVALFTSCNFPTPEPSDTPDEICTSIDDFTLRLLEPTDGAFVYAIESVAGRPPNLRWSFLGLCSPEEFRVLVGTDEGISTPLISEEVDSATREWQIDVDLEVDLLYYWTVALLADGELLWSPAPFTFQTLPVPEGQPGVISGRVWQDVCELPEDYDPLDLPDSCANVEGAPFGNGVLDDGEAGIPGVEVRIAQGACPPVGSGVLASSGPTDESGYYYYFAPVGTYCVTVVPEDPGNDTILLPGRFTHPIHESMPIGTAYIKGAIESDGQIVEGIDFGWEYTGDEASSGIGGIVWLDEDNDGMMNENRWGIYEIDVSLYQGACAADHSGGRLAGSITDQTGAFGVLGSGPHSYDFDTLLAGMYCLQLSYSAGSIPWEFDSPLGEGNWTYPTLQDFDPSNLPEWELSLSAGEVRSDVNFGFHAMPFIISESSVNCRSAPYLSSVVENYLSVDQHYWLKGRVGDNSWWFVDIPDCWVGASVVSFYGDPNDLPIYPWPPTPTPKPQDVTPPLVEINHSPGAPEINDTVTFTATAGDNIGVAKIYIWVKVGASWPQNPVKTCNNATSCTYIGGPYDEGEVSYYATAKDAAGNEGQSIVHGFDVIDPYQ